MYSNCKYRQTEIYIPKNKYEINSHTQRFQDTVYNFIHNCILNYIHTETNLSLDQLIVSKYSALITTCLIHMKNFVSIDVPSDLSFHKSTIKSQVIFFGQYIKITYNQQCLFNSL